ncbi:recombinase family protein [Phreatobacter sp.]|uniref:recombinase family protein n=1 Tax=Phreatobacter sp. TaxID=1966341 RepID=UPI003F721929
MTSTPSNRRAAIYTRKSSEEGLEQDFNSLDAQREACLAYIRSQRSEGWRPVPTAYDDGGHSGGSMERPALKALLADIAAGRIDIVVVYKIDRLTRSLADFARMVEVFERHQVSFVSVTQAFNTTTSMGRLTLNVLLSFAQFEREVTGERIRDKIAASKARGMWMGGNVPLGYDRPSSGPRTLTINEPEAAIVSHIFAAYLDLGSVHALERDLIARDIRTRVTTSARGRSRGGVHFSRGNLFHLLRNRLYLGEIVHKDRHYPGLHPPIIDRAVFEAVQARLDGQARRQGKDGGGMARAGLAGGGKAASTLTGRIFDADGHPMSPTFAYGRGGTIYRYYVSAPLQQGGKLPPADDTPRRISATAIEDFIANRLSMLGTTGDRSKHLERTRRIEVLAGRIRIEVLAEDIRNAGSTPGADESAIPHPTDPERTILSLACRFSTRRGRTEIVEGDRHGPRPDRALIRALRAAHAAVRRDALGLPILDEAPKTPQRHRMVRLAFLAPQIQKAILAGTQPPSMTLASLTQGTMPILWTDQLRQVGMT